MKRIFIFALLLLTTIAFGQGTNPQGEYYNDPSTVLLLHMNETGGNAVSDGGMYNFTGTIASGVSFASGRFGNATSYANQGYLTIPHHPALNLSDMTVEMWIYPTMATFTMTGADQGMGLVSKRANNVPQPYLCVLYNGGVLGFNAHYQPANNWRTDGTPPGALKLNTWQHIAVTRRFTGTETVLKFYVNGVLATESTFSQMSATQNTEPLWIGKDPYHMYFTDQGTYQGKIDELRLSSTVRLPREFNLQLPPTDLFGNANGTTATLNWQNGGGAVNAMRYKIYRGTDSTNVTLIDSTLTTSYTNYGLASMTRYYYRVSTVDITGFEGAMSAAASIMTGSAPPPSISSFLPSSGPVGTNVTIAGSNFGPAQGTGSIKFGGFAATPTSWNDAQITAPVPAGASGSVTISVTANGQLTTSPTQFTVTLPVPTISSFTPPSGSVGTSVKITGTNFGPTQGTSSVMFGAYGATPTSWTDTQIMVPVPPGVSGMVTIYVTVSGQTANSATPFAVAQLVPTIASFTPPSGTPGTGVTITGTNFNATPSNNIVYMGGVRASVVAATTTSLSITVPYGAMYGPISVTDTVKHLTAISAKSYIVTFTPASNLDAGSFASVGTFGTGGSPWGVRLADIDGDGNLDVLTPNNGAAYTFSILRNSTVTGAVTLASKVDFATTGAAGALETADFDGDGKLDVLVSGMLGCSVLRNKSAVAALSLGTRLDLSSPYTSSGLAVNDIDGDGRPDIVSANSGNSSFSVFHNVSYSTSIGFEPRVDVPTFDTAPVAGPLTDYNGDGKLDMVILNSNSNSFSVFQNTSAAGSISFGTRFDFATGARPIGAAVADVNGDGMTDVVVTNSNSGTASIFINTSTLVAISFAPRSDLMTGTSPNGVSISDVDGDGKVDIVVTNQGSSSISVFKNTTPTASSPTFMTKIDYAATSPQQTAIGDMDRDGKPDMVVNATTINVVNILRNTLGSVGLPATPNPLGASTISSTQISLSWMDNSNNEDGFRIERKTGPGGAYTEIATVAANVTSFQNTPLTPSTQYYYQVRAYNIAGNSTYSNEANATTFASASSPNAPSGLTAATVSSSQINISWTDNSTNEDGFRIERRTGLAGAFDSIATVGANATSFQNFGLASSTEYSYQVRAYNAGGYSNYSNIANATTQSSGSVLNSPSGLSASAVSSSQINLAWTDNSTNEDGFRIERRTGLSGAFDSIAVVGANATSFQNFGLTSSTEYSYQVRAYNTGGYSSYSNMANATTQSSGTVLNSPSGLSASAVSSSQINLAWTDNSTNEDGFRIEQKVGASGFWGEIVSVGPSVQSYQCTGLTPSTPYSFRVRAYNSAGHSGYSNEANATTPVFTDNVPPVIEHDSTLVSAYSTSSSFGIAISASASDAQSGMMSLTLQFRRAGSPWSSGGNASYSSFTNGSAMIPGNFMSSNALYGVDYRIKAVDVSNNTVYTPVHSVTIMVSGQTDRVDAMGNSITQPNADGLAGGVPTEYAYRMFSVPYELDNKSFIDVLENRTGLGAYDIKRWRFFRWNTMTSSYDDYPGFRNEPGFEVGSAYFLILKSSTIIRVGPGKVVRAEDIDKKGITLTGGTNFVGNPFNFDVPLDSLRLANNESLSNRTWAFVGQGGTNGGWQPNPSTLKAWEGILVRPSGPTTLRFSTTDRPRTNIVSSPPSAVVRETANPWQARITAVRTDNGVTDSENLFGVAPSSGPALFEPPMVGGQSVSVAFDSPDGPVTHDFRSDADSGWVWDFRVTTPDANATVTLSFEGLRVSGPGYLIDKNSQALYKLNEISAIPVNTLTGKREFRIVVGSEAFVEDNSFGIELEPSTFTLHQNYPNPFNPSTSVAYTLAQASHVRVSVSDLLGREVAVLQNGMFGAGYHSVVWDAAGSGSGTFVCRVTVAGVDGNASSKVVKMTLLK